MEWGKGWKILILSRFTEKFDFQGGGVGGLKQNQYIREHSLKKEWGFGQFQEIREALGKKSRAGGEGDVMFWRREVDIAMHTMKIYSWLVLSRQTHKLNFKLFFTALCGFVAATSYPHCLTPFACKSFVFT